MRSKLYQVTAWFNSEVIPNWLQQTFKAKSPGGMFAIKAYRKLRLFYEAFPSHFTDEEIDQIKTIMINQDNPEPSPDPVMLSRIVESGGNTELAKKILSMDPLDIYFTHEKIYLDICV